MSFKIRNNIRNCNCNCRYDDGFRIFNCSNVTNTYGTKRTYPSFWIYNNNYVKSDTLYVSKDGCDGNNGLTKKCAFATIKHAINVSSDGMKIIVLNGVYNEGSEIIVNKSITIISEEGRDNTEITRTIDPDNKYRIISILNEGAVVEGFTISNGDTTYDSIAHGGNVYIDYLGTLNDCIVKNGASFQYGGNIAIWGVEGGYVNRCEVYDGLVTIPTGGLGGGIYARNFCVIDSCFSHNNGKNNLGAGNGISSHQRDDLNNYSKDSLSGSGNDTIGAVTADALIINCTVTNNSGGSFFGIIANGMVIVRSTNIKNCIVWDNDTIDVGLIVYDTTKFNYNDYGDIQFVATPPVNTTNIQLDPEFTITPHILYTSPCANSGSDAISEFDLNMNIRPSLTNPSMGCVIVTVT